MKFLRQPVVRLTLWYVLILSVIVALFSAVTVALSIREFERNIDGSPERRFCLTKACQEDQLRRELITESSNRFLNDLLIFDASVVILGAIASYFFARQTLKPVDEMIERQQRFSSDVAHELRTPLAVMQSEIEVELRDKAASKSSLRQRLSSNLEEVGRLQEMTDRLLTLSSTTKLELEPVDLQAVVSQAQRIIQSRADGRKVTITAEVEPAIAKGNFNSLVDVVVILLDNAIKYSPSNSEVRLIGRMAGRRAELSVIDQGVGMDEKTTSQVFNRFYRADDSRCQTNCDGFGLGLSLAKQIITLHGGKIEVISSPGKGTTFTIKI